MSSLPGTELLQYRLLTRVGTSVWRAEDSATGKPFAIKILTRQLPKDSARRDQLVREVRLGAALYHPFLVTIADVVCAGETLGLVMEWIDGEPLTKKLDGKPLPAAQFNDLAYQLADVVKLLQSRNMIHGNINGDSVMIASSGQINLGGLNGVNLTARREGASSPAYQQKGSDPRSVAYMAPEQIAGYAMDARADVFSLGVVYFQMATGALPWAATDAVEIARAIVEGQPRSPRTLNPAINSDVMALIGRCMFKEAHRRLKDARTVVEDLAKASPESVRLANGIAARERTPSQAPANAETRGSVLLLADLAEYDDLVQVDAEAANRAAARLQQLVGEAAYLFDGHVIDPFGPRVVAEMPDVASALEAARKAEFDFSPEQQEGDVLDVRLLLHAGEVHTEDGRVTGEAVARGFAALGQIQPRKLFISESFARLARGSIRLRDIGGRGGLKIYEIVPPEPEPEPAPTEDEEAIATVAIVEAPPPPMRSRSAWTRTAVAAGLLLLGIGIAGIVMSRHETPQQVTTAAPPRAASNAIAVGQFSVEGAEPVLLERANAIRLVSLEILRTIPGLRLADGASNATVFAARLRDSAHGAEMIPVAAGADAGAPSPVPDVAAGVSALMSSIAVRTHTQPRLPAAEAMNAFGDALLAQGEKDEARTASSLRRAVKADPAFMPAQLAAMNFFAERSRPADALAAAREVFAHDPSNATAARLVARGSLDAGDLAGAFTALNALVHVSKADAEALNTIGRYAASAGDQQRFTQAVHALQSVPVSDQGVHEPDLLVNAGNIDAAIDKYYDIEARSPANPALSLKIGRIAVLRRTTTVADLELAKLQQSDPRYGYHILKAYMAAGRGARADAQNELKTAFTASHVPDDYWTSAADVYAILGDSRGVIAGLQKAVDRHEPTTGYILNDRLFAYLSSDPQFQKVRQSIAAEQDQVRTALARITM